MHCTHTHTCIAFDFQFSVDIYWTSESQKKVAVAPEHQGLLWKKQSKSKQNDTKTKLNRAEPNNPAYNMHTHTHIHSEINIKRGSAIERAEHRGREQRQKKRILTITTPTTTDTTK